MEWDGAWRRGLVAEHALYARLVTLVDQRRGAQITLALGRLLGQDVACKSPLPLETAGPGPSKTLFGAAVGLHFGHKILRSLGRNENETHRGVPRTRSKNTALLEG